MCDERAWNTLISISNIFGAQRFLQFSIRLGKAMMNNYLSANIMKLTHSLNTIKNSSKDLYEDVIGQACSTSSYVGNDSFFIINSWIFIYTLWLKTKNIARQSFWKNKKPVKEEHINNTYFWNSVTILSKLNSLTATHESTNTNSLSSLMHCKDCQGSNFISSRSFLIMKSLLHDFDFISTWPSLTFVLSTLSAPTC